MRPRARAVSADLTPGARQGGSASSVLRSCCAIIGAFRCHALEPASTTSTSASSPRRTSSGRRGSPRHWSGISCGSKRDRPVSSDAASRSSPAPETGGSSPSSSKRILGAQPVSYAAAATDARSIPRSYTRLLCRHPPREREGSAKIAYSFRRPAKMLKALRLRWPNPIQATIRVGGPFNELPRLPFQLWECVLRTVHFLTQVPTLVRERSFRPVRGSGTAPAATEGEGVGKKGRRGSRSRKAECLTSNPRSPDSQPTPRNPPSGADFQGVEAR